MTLTVPQHGGLILVIYLGCPEPSYVKCCSPHAFLEDAFLEDALSLEHHLSPAWISWTSESKRYLTKYDQ